MDIMFAMSATSSTGEPVFTSMKNTVKEIINAYGLSFIKYSVAVFGSSFARVFDFTARHESKSIIKKLIDSASRIKTGPPSLTNAFTEIKTTFDAQSLRPNARRVLVVMMEESSTQTEFALMSAATSLRSSNILVIAVSFGRQISIQEFDWITLNRFYVMMMSPKESPRHVGLEIMTRAFKGE